MMKSQHICSPFARALKQVASRSALNDAAFMSRIGKIQRHGSDKMRAHYVNVLANGPTVSAG